MPASAKETGIFLFGIIFPADYTHETHGHINVRALVLAAYPQHMVMNGKCLGYPVGKFIGSAALGKPGEGNHGQRFTQYGFRGIISAGMDLFLKDFAVFFNNASPCL